MAHLLSEDKISDFRCAFDLFDQDKDNFISTKELGDVLKKLGRELTEKELHEIISEVDDDKNGKIDFKEFLDLMAGKMKDEDGDNELMDAFSLIDIDNNGYITKNEFKKVMEILGEPLTQEELDEVMKDYDDDGDDQLTFDDFRNMMNSTS